MRSRCDRSMFAWTLNTKPENGASSGHGLPFSSSRALGAGARSMSASSSSRTPKLVSADPKKVGDSSPPRNSSSS